MANVKIEPDEKSTLRLLMPQWQGGGMRPNYYFGGRLLAWLAPDSNAAVEEVPVDQDKDGLMVDRGIFARDILLKQARDAKRILSQRKPDRVVILGGECSVDFAPFAYLNERYEGELTVLWLDAHTDLGTNEREEDYENFHGMVLSALMGMGDSQFVAEVPMPIDPSRVMFVGLRSFMEPLEEIETKYGIRFPIATAEQVENDSTVVLDWLESLKASQVAIHFDLDVLEPTEFNSAAWHNPNGLKTEAAVRLIEDVSREFDVVGLGITEYTPHDAILLSKMLQRMPILTTP